GYDSAINFSEETEGEARQAGRRVVLTASIGIALQLGTFLLVVFGVPDIKAFVNSATPMLDAAKTSFGDTFYRIVAIGAIIAILNACLAITLQFARIVWAAGRDRAWPTVISEWIGKVEPTRGATCRDPGKCRSGRRRPSSGWLASRSRSASRRSTTCSSSPGSSLPGSS